MWLAVSAARLTQPRQGVRPAYGTHLEERRDPDFASGATVKTLWEKEMFANQNTAVRLRDTFTIERLTEAFGLGQEDEVASADGSTMASNSTHGEVSPDFPT